MSDAVEQVQERSFVKGLVAGLVGGLVATAAKSLAEKIYPPRTEGQPEPPEVLADKLAGHELSGPAKAIAAETIHWDSALQRARRMAYWRSTSLLLRPRMVRALGWHLRR